MVRIIPAATSEHLETVRQLFTEYREVIGAPCCLQHLDEELISLPGNYSPPGGRLLLAICAGQPTGCVALRPLSALICEIKRLYVKTAWQGKGIGKTLLTAVLAAARDSGYTCARLDTLSSMQAAIHLYRSMGFKDIARYNDNTLAEALFMEYQLIASYRHQQPQSDR